MKQALVDQAATTLTAYFVAQGQPRLEAEGAAYELLQEAPPWIVERHYNDAPNFVMSMELRRNAFPKTRRVRS